MSPWLPKRTARSAPASFSPPSRKLPPVAAQKFQMAYHLMFDCEQLQTPLLDTTSAHRAPSLWPGLGGMDGVRRRRRGTARGPGKKRQVFPGIGPPRAGPRHHVKPVASSSTALHCLQFLHRTPHTPVTAARGARFDYLLTETRRRGGGVRWLTRDTSQICRICEIMPHSMIFP